MHSSEAEEGIAGRMYEVENSSMSSFTNSRNKRDQQRALLGGDDDETTTEARKLPESYGKTPYHGLRMVALCIAALGLVVLVAHQLFTGPVQLPSAIPFNNASTHAEDTHFRGQNGADLEYVLSQDWQFDAPPMERVFNWVIQDKELNPDGVYRPMMVINGQFPGPLIQVNEGDTVVVNIDNQATNATSIHWHGLFQNGTNHMDGTVGVTQCPIAPGTIFTYKFKVEQQYGTYWYHSHQGVQSADGLMGPLIVHSKQEQKLQSLEYATDRIVMVSDHYHDLSSNLLMKYLKSDAENAEPVPDSAVINGRGILDCSKFEHRRCDNSSLSLPRLDLERGRKHRLRLINTGAFAEFQISLDEHEFAVTEVDGTTVVPSYYDRLNINPAQRYSIIVSPNATSTSSFWFRAKMLTTCFTDPPPSLEPEIRAIIALNLNSSSDSALPSSKDISDGGPDLICRDMDTKYLIPTPAIAAPATADETFYLRSNFEIGAWRLSRGVFNQSSFKPDVQSPSLHRAVDGLSSGNASWLAPPSSNTTTNDIVTHNTTASTPSAFINSLAFHEARELVLQTTSGLTIDLIISNFDDGNHPLHLHGYKFFVLAQGHGYPPANLSSTVDVSNPLRRDTASVEAFGWVMLRIVADNPGMWALHCHLAWHSEAGLVMQLMTMSDRMGERAIPQKNLDLCSSPLTELSKGMGPKDEEFMVKDDD